MKQSLHYNYYYFPVLILVLLGITDTLYLAVSHYRNYTDITYASFCAFSKSINCDTVSQSAWSHLFGIPVAFWGLAGYLLYFFILIPGRKNTAETMPLWSALQILGLLYSITAIFFGYVSAKIIQSYCLMCFFSYSISFLLFFYTLIIRKRFDKKSFLQNIFQFFKIVKNNIFIKYSILSLVLIFIGLYFFLPRYWVYEYPFPQLSSNISTGFTENGSPWIGAQNPQLTIEEFSDYQCFQCSKLHSFLRHLIQQHPEKIRLIHHHYPLDHNYNPILIHEPFHVGSGEMALLAIYASREGKFWEMNDELYKFTRSGDKKELDLQILAEILNLPLNELRSALTSNDYKVKLTLDIQKGLDHGITGTPAYLVDDKLYQGTLPPNIIRKLLQ